MWQVGKHFARRLGFTPCGTMRILCWLLWSVSGAAASLVSTTQAVATFTAAEHDGVHGQVLFTQPAAADDGGGAETTIAVSLDGLNDVPCAWHVHVGAADDGGTSCGTDVAGGHFDPFASGGCGGVSDEPRRRRRTAFPIPGPLRALSPPSSACDGGVSRCAWRLQKRERTNRLLSHSSCLSLSRAHLPFLSCGRSVARATPTARAHRRFIRTTTSGSPTRPSRARRVRASGGGLRRAHGLKRAIARAADEIN